MSEEIVIRGGTLVTLDPQHGIIHGDILIRDGIISQIGQVEPTEDAEVIDVPNGIVLPGLVDTHRHTWQSSIRHRNGDHHGPSYFAELLNTTGPSFTPEDVYAGTLLGALSAIDAGTTTMYDWSHVQNSPAHADAAIRALRESGLRAIFGHGRSLARPEERTAQRGERHSDDLRRIQEEHFSTPSLLSLSMAARGPELADDGVWQADLEFARELGLLTSVHVGIFDLGPRYRAVEKMHEAGLLDRDIVFVHGNSCSDEELGYIAEAGCGVSIGPQVEAISMAGPLPTDRMMAKGIWPSLSGDTETMGSGDLFTQMRVVHADYGLKLVTGKNAPGSPDQILTESLLEMATVHGASALGMADRIGTISVGKAADIIIIDGGAINLAPVNDPIGAIVLAAHPGNVDTVIIDGRLLKRHGKLVGFDVERVIALAVESNRRHPARNR